MSRFPSVQSLLKYRKYSIQPMVGDGNCFYRAVAQAYYKDVEMHHILRRTVMEHMMEDIEEYAPYFESKSTLLGKLNANKRLGVWNSELGDLVPQALSDLLGCQLEIYSVSNEEVQVYIFGEGSKIRLLYRNNHYDLLLKD